MDSIIDHSEQDTSGGRLKALVKASLIAVSADIFLIILKAVLAKITGSAVLLADAWHSGGDFAVSFTVLLSILIRHKLSHIPWAKHAEGIVALLISLVLILGSLRVVSSVFSREAEGFTLQCGIPLVIAILGISAACVVAFEMYRYKKRIGERYKSIAFLAESDHTHSDYFSSFGVFLTLIIGYFGIHIERITTFFVGILIFRIGALLFFKALNFFGINFKSINNLSSFIPSGLSGTYKRISVLFGIIFSPIKRLFEKIPLTEKWIAAHKKIIIFSTIILVLLLYLGTGFYSVMPYQTGVELLFGRVIELNAPGAHFHAPQPFGNNIKVDTEVYARVECGYRTVWDFIGKEPEAYLWEYTHSKGRYIKVTEESISITGDENLIDANFLCYYKITDPVQYAMNNENAHELLRSVFCAKVHNIIGQYHLDSLLTTGRRTVQDHIFEDLRKTVNMIPLGLEIISVYLE
ncbi:MAG: cation transporter, partial [FCB group bacterium]|nr:cation transporter [FCB group bacterium]